MTASLRRIRALTDTGQPGAIVSDLDGVLRVFDDQLWEQLDEQLEAEPGTSFAAILAHPFLEEVTRGRGTHAQWRERAAEHLTESGIDPEQARATVRRWADTPAMVDQAVLTLLLEARAQGLPVFVLTNGTDRVREEIEALDLARVIGPDGQFLLNSADLGHAKPEQEAFRLAHQRIEQTLGRELEPQEIVFLDDTQRHIHGAQQFGWQAVLHR